MSRSTPSGEPSPTPKWRQRRGTLSRSVSSGVVVADRDGEIHHLAHPGAGIWSLLSEPRTLDDLCAAIVADLRDADPDRVRRDTVQLLGVLEVAGLVERCGAGGAHRAQGADRGAESERKGPP